MISTNISREFTPFSLKIQILGPREVCTAPGPVVNK